MIKKISRINLNLIVSLHLLLQELSVTKAAQRQFISQSAMSKNLAKLRELFNDPLLIKAGPELTPTNKAMQLAPEVAKLVQAMDGLFSSQEFDPMECRKEFTIASTDYVSEYILPKALADIYRAAPHISINVQNWDKQTYQLLKEGKVDLGTTIQDPNAKDMHASLINRDYFVCIMRQDHPLSAKSSLSLQDFADYHHAVITVGTDKTTAIDRALAEKGVTRKVRLRVSSYPSAVNMVAQSNLLLTLPSHIAKRLSEDHPVTIKPLPIEIDEFDCTLQWHHRNHQDPAHRWFRTRLAELIQAQELDPI
ncbi:LysR family transcriptional regulator [Motilimonas cestriensis]|uniref:LysR family transcriptional regulator n=1 Tax=Motilimonas cestriensis TaxID=2742685 RepID=A0ABS8W828_9GAMM|nr:LysR family transcriptional regulator [Motilimonas cestriensis]MCE2594703.1 LysR family transcriptional regulator [Motilimonas cestriensis]